MSVVTWLACITIWAPQRTQVNICGLTTSNITALLMLFSWILDYVLLKSHLTIVKNNIPEAGSVIFITDSMDISLSKLGDSGRQEPGVLQSMGSQNQKRLSNWIKHLHGIPHRPAVKAMNLTWWLGASLYLISTSKYFFSEQIAESPTVPGLVISLFLFIPHTVPHFHQQTV